MDTLTDDRWTAPCRPAGLSETILLSHIKTSYPQKRAGSVESKVGMLMGRQAGPKEHPWGFQAVLVLLAKVFQK